MEERLNEVLIRFPQFVTDTQDRDESPVYVVCEEGWYWYIPSNLPVMGEWKGEKEVQLNDGLLAAKTPAPQRAGMIKHFNWSLGDERGRVAIKIENDVIELRQIGGNAPPAAMFAWGNVIAGYFEIKDGVWASSTPDQATADGAMASMQYARQIHAQRRNRYAVLRRDGMSGAHQYRLVVEKNAALMDFPTVATLHISCAGKLNQGFKMWLGDFHAIYSQWAADYAHVTKGTAALMNDGDDDLHIEEVPTRQDGIQWKDAAREYADYLESVAFADALLGRMADATLDD